MRANAIASAVAGARGMIVALVIAPGSKQSIVARTVSADAPKSSALRTSLAICERRAVRRSQVALTAPGGLVESANPAASVERWSPTRTSVLPGSSSL